MVLVAIPVFLLVLGAWGIKRIRSRVERILIGIGLAILLVYFFELITHVIPASPGWSGIVVQGKSPQGQEYCVVQTYQGMFEYLITFYVRDTQGVWRRNTLDPDADAWRSATVEFTNGIARVRHNGVQLRDIPMPTGTVEIAEVPLGEQDMYCPSSYSVEDVFKFHNKRFRP